MQKKASAGNALLLAVVAIAAIAAGFLVAIMREKNCPKPEETCAYVIGTRLENVVKGQPDELVVSPECNSIYMHSAGKNLPPPVPPRLPAK
jgi:hypothetical protein